MFLSVFIGIVVIMVVLSAFVVLLTWIVDDLDRPLLGLVVLILGLATLGAGYVSWVGRDREPDYKPESLEQKGYKMTRCGYVWVVAPKDYPIDCSMVGDGVHTD